MTDFAASVYEFRAARDRFDASPSLDPPHAPLRLDAGPLLEQLAVVRETLMARSTTRCAPMARDPNAMCRTEGGRRVRGSAPPLVLAILASGGAWTSGQIAERTGMACAFVCATLQRLAAAGLASRVGTTPADNGKLAALWKGEQR
jgi:hypothetical protein